MKFAGTRHIVERETWDERAHNNGGQDQISWR